jgi:hypothetical protein
LHLCGCGELLELRLLPPLLAALWCFEERREQLLQLDGKHFGFFYALEQDGVLPAQEIDFRFELLDVARLIFIERAGARLALVGAPSSAGARAERDFRAAALTSRLALTGLRQVKTRSFQDSRFPGSPASYGYGRRAYWAGSMPT